MRRASLLLFTSFALACVVACAASNEAPTEQNDQPGNSTVGDAATDAADGSARDAEPDGEVDASLCSAAGWCDTSLPDADLVFKDVWPFERRAFAIAESPTLGVKIVEWTDAANAWHYIDDDTQNEPGFGAYAGNLWAPNEDEIYYAVAPGTIYHGVRGTDPSSPWSWTRHRLPDNATDGDPSEDHGRPNYPIVRGPYPALGVWGTNANDVYAWYSNTLFHSSTEGGGTWETGYVANDPDDSTEDLFFLSAGGTDPDNVWFAGVRSRPYANGCVLLVRKVGNEYRRIADGIVDFDCAPKPGYFFVDGTGGWLTNLQARSAKEIIGIKGAYELVRISADDDAATTEGVYSLARSVVPRTVGATTWLSMWSSSNDLWVTGPSLVVHGTDVWNPAEAYRVSTISLSGAPLGIPIHQVRGTSNTNLWSVGVRHALHKTTP